MHAPWKADNLPEQYCPAQNTDSPQSWGLVGSWLKQCAENHDRCNALVPEPWAPTRLLDISRYDDGLLRLVENNHNISSKQPYATLSHCWGRNPIIRTLTSRLEEFHRGIPLHELSKSFREAITVARHLKVQYLWIDSLCIVQDSQEDWTREASTMSKVYRYALINIAATGASDGTQGCFWKRNARNTRPTEFDINWRNTLEGEGKRYQVVLDADLWAQKLVNEPLMR